jgi:hypothetical protein
MPFDIPFYVLNPWMLTGLAVVSIPVIIHLLNRRRYDVVDWGAMQFLKVSEVTRRRLLIEELLLLLLRMALLAVFVVALAGPFTDSPLLQRVMSRPNRDVVLVFDGSASMGATGGGATPHDAAKEWAQAFLDDLTPGDGVAVLQAKQQVVPVVGDVSQDLTRAREAVNNLPPPAGGVDWPGALKAAHDLLAASQRPEREIVLLGDGQRYGWADEAGRMPLRWEMLAADLGYTRPQEPGGLPRPRVWVVNLAADRSATPPNWSLGPLRCSPAVVPVGRVVTFTTAIDLHGQAFTPPHKVRLEVDGRPVRDLEIAKAARAEKGKVPLRFTHRFAAPGSHLVTVVLEPDPPPENRPPGYVVKDHVPGDNRQDLSVEVVEAVPVLLVDGDPNPAGRPGAAYFLHAALTPKGDPNPIVQARTVPLADFDPALLAGDPARGEADNAKPGEGRPRVLVLCNVSRLTPQQDEAVQQFLADGGGVLAVLGDHTESDAYNASLFRDGKGWLPARLDAAEGDPERPNEGVRPVPVASERAVFDLPLGLESAHFGRWWKLSTPGKSGGVTVAALRSAAGEYPFLVERTWQAGRVLLCAVPLDTSWGSTLPEKLGFVPLAHELVYYLAGARSSEFNLQAGQPLRYRLNTDSEPDKFRLRPPVGEEWPLATALGQPNAYHVEIVTQPRGAQLVYGETREAGVYRLQTPDGRTVYYVVQPDPRESDLTPCTDADRQKVATFFKPAKDEEPKLFRYENDRGGIVAALTTAGQRQEVWWWFLIGLIALLCGEVWMTRRMVRNR